MHPERYVGEGLPARRRGVCQWMIGIGLLMLLSLLLSIPKCARAEAHVEKARRFVGQGNPTGTQGNWCADFVSFVYASDLPVPPSRSAKALWNAFKAAGLTTEDPQPGDLIFFWRERPGSWKGHVGIVARVSDEQVVTIEGNVGSDEGAVQLREYARGAIPRLLGYGRVE